ncbi:MAG TPA: hypothetical protein VHY36_13980 [Steroidobacteraceae bacterium]|jgi:hypothetical protein|nr:hypothetical protein [Steroidobacteraceae bacterium]
MWRIYGAVSTLAFVVIAVSGFAVARQKASFGTVDVQRINVVEPDGTLRMVISDRARFPGAIIHGKEYPFDRHTAGMLFFNDEGTENGGLIFGGQKNKDGTVSSYGHLSFDRYEQDQELNLEYLQDGAGQSTKLAFLDQPDWPITDALKLPRSHWPHFAATHPHGTPRLMMSRAQDGSVSLGLKDKQGHTRILIKVASDGTPVIELLDSSGKVVSQLSQPR